MRGINEKPYFLNQYEKGIYRVPLENDNHILKYWKGRVIRMWNGVSDKPNTKEPKPTESTTTIERNDTLKYSTEYYHQRYLKCRDHLLSDSTIPKWPLYSEKEWGSMPQEELVKIITDGLLNTEKKYGHAYYKMIKYIKNKDVKVVFDKYFEESIKSDINSDFCEIITIGITKIQYISDKDTKDELYNNATEIIINKLNDLNNNPKSNLYDFRKYAYITQYIEDTQNRNKIYNVLERLITENLKYKWDVRRQRMCINAISFIQDEFLKIKLIKSGINHPVWKIRKAYYFIVNSIKNDEVRKGIIKHGMREYSYSVRKLAISLLQDNKNYLIEEELINTEDYRKNIKKYILPTTKSQHSLYKYKSKSRKINRNSGSNTSNTLDKLVDSKHNNMLGKVYKRETTPNAFLLQMKAFEARETWKRLGFAHIPIETIYRFRVEKNKEGNSTDKISFFAKVYDDVLTNLVNTDMYIIYRKSIQEQKDKIQKGLKELGINHDDFDDRNICISWQRDENNNQDFTKPPLLYLIDWDRAKMI